MRPIPDDVREYTLNRDGWRCVECGKPATQIAHRIPNQKSCLKVYGADVINSPANLAAACGLECNYKLQARSWDWDAIAEDIKQ